MGCGVYWQQVKEVERALKTMKKFGIGEEDPAYITVMEKRNELLVNLGVKLPRAPIDLMPTVWVSPESFRAWLDPEVGWVVMAKRRDGAPPVYHNVRDEVAIAVIKKELTPQLKEELLTPDEYLGE